MRNVKKRVLAFMLAICMVFTFIPSSAMAEEYGQTYADTSADSVMAQNEAQTNAETDYPDPMTGTTDGGDAEKVWGGGTIRE